MNSDIVGPTTSKIKVTVSEKICCFLVQVLFSPRDRFESDLISYIVFVTIKLK